MHRNYFSKKFLSLILAITLLGSSIPLSLVGFSSNAPIKTGGDVTENDTLAEVDSSTESAIDVYEEFESSTESAIDAYEEFESSTESAIDVYEEFESSTESAIDVYEEFESSTGTAIDTYEEFDASTESEIDVYEEFESSTGSAIDVYEEFESSTESAIDVDQQSAVVTKGGLKVQKLATGAWISFGGQKWQLIEPNSGYLIMDDNYNGSSLFSEDEIKESLYEKIIEKKDYGKDIYDMLFSDGKNEELLENWDIKKFIEVINTSVLGEESLVSKISEMFEVIKDNKGTNNINESQDSDKEQTQKFNKFLYEMMKNYHGGIKWNSNRDNTNAEDIFRFLHREFEFIIDVENSNTDWIEETKWIVQGSYNKDDEYSETSGGEIQPKNFKQKLGIISVQEWNKYKEKIENPSSYSWTRSPVYSSESKVFLVDEQGEVVSYEADVKKGVRPTLYLEVESKKIVVKEGTGKYDDPFVLIEKEEPTWEELTQEILNMPDGKEEDMATGFYNLINEQVSLDDKLDFLERVFYELSEVRELESHIRRSVFNILRDGAARLNEKASKIELTPLLENGIYTYKFEEEDIQTALDMIDYNIETTKRINSIIADNVFDNVFELQTVFNIKGVEPAYDEEVNDEDDEEDDEEVNDEDDEEVNDEDDEDVNDEDDEEVNDEDDEDVNDEDDEEVNDEDDEDVNDEDDEEVVVYPYEVILPLDLKDILYEKQIENIIMQTPVASLVIKENSFISTRDWVLRLVAQEISFRAESKGINDMGVNEFELEVFIDGEKLEKFQRHTVVTVRLPYKHDDKESEHVLTVKHPDLNQNTINKAGYYNEIENRMVFNTDHFSMFFITTNKQNFADLEKGSNSWSKRFVESLAARGIVSGRGDGNFGVDDHITRGDVAVMIANSFHLLDTNATSHFSDVDEDNPEHYFAPHIASLYNLRIVRGTGENFEPEKNITRQDASIMLANAILYNHKSSLSQSDRSDEILGNFKDSDKVAGYARRHIAFMVRLGILQGHDGYLNPEQKLTRAQMATLIYQATALQKLQDIPYDVRTAIDVS